MAGLTVEIKRNQARGDKKVDGFTGGVRSLEVLNLEVEVRRIRAEYQWQCRTVHYGRTYQRQC